MITKRGSQNREPLSESGYHLKGWITLGVAVLQANDDETQQEVWFANDDHAGYTIEIDSVGYEFARDYRPEKDGLLVVTLPKPNTPEKQLGCVLVFSKGMSTADAETVLASIEEHLDHTPRVEEFDPAMGGPVWYLP
jgi:hypothetical protein